MKTKVIGAMNAALVVGAMVAVSASNVSADVSSIGDQRRIEAQCDLQVSGTKSFPYFQNALNSVTDANHDGLRVLCLAGTVVNDDRPAPTGRGDAPAVLRVFETDAAYSPLVVRGNNADGTRSRIRMVRTATSNSDYTNLFTGYTTEIVLENLEFHLDYQRPAGPAAMILDLGAQIQLRNIEVRGLSNGASVFGVNAFGTGTIENVDIRLVGTTGTSTALSIDGDFSSLRRIDVEGSGRTDLLQLRPYARIDDLSELSAVGIDDGIVLQDMARIIHLRGVSVNALGSGLAIEGRGGVEVLGAASEYDEADLVTITACVPLRIERWGGIQSMKHAVFNSKRGC